MLTFWYQDPLGFEFEMYSNQTAHADFLESGSKFTFDNWGYVVNYTDPLGVNYLYNQTTKYWNTMLELDDGSEIKVNLAQDPNFMF